MYCVSPKTKNLDQFQSQMKESVNYIKSNTWTYRCIPAHRPMIEKKEFVEMFAFLSIFSINSATEANGIPVTIYSLTKPFKI